MRRPRALRSPRRLAVVAMACALAVLATACVGGGVRTVEAELTRAHNLFPGTAVKVRGVEVGQVADVAAPESEPVAVATLRLDGDVALPAEATARVVQGSVLGERFVQLGPEAIDPDDGPTLADGDRIPVERTEVPAEFDELLSSLEEFLDGLPPEELDRFLTETAATIEGQGEDLGRALSATADAVEVLREEDDALVTLLERVADVTETLGSRDQRLRELLGDYAELSGALAEEREVLDAALAESARLVVELEDLLAEQGERLGASTEVLTRVLQSVDRNRDQLVRAVHGQAELYRHGERVFDRTRNWLPLINQSADLPRLVSERLAARFAGLCERAGLGECALPAFWEQELPVRVCLDPLLPCEVPDGEEPAAGLDEAITDAAEAAPGLEEELLADTAAQEAERAAGETSEGDGGAGEDGDDGRDGRDGQDDGSGRDDGDDGADAGGSGLADLLGGALTGGR